MAANYRVAIIGTGRMGGLIEDEIPPGSFSKPYGHFSAYQSIPETEVVAVANRGRERLDRFSNRFGITNTYLDYRQMIEVEKPDIVSITTPSLHRAEPIIFCAEHGVKGIYAEKGLCASLAEADRVAAAVRANKVAFNWGVLRRYNDGYRRLRAEIASGAIGAPRYVVMSFYTDIIKHHPHTIDVVSMMLGDPEPEWVEGHLVEPSDPRWPANRPPVTFDAREHRFVPAPGREIGDPMVGFFRLHFKDGTEGVFLPVPGRFDVDVYGTEGRAYAWADTEFRVNRINRRTGNAEDTIIRPTGESPTVCAIREIIREIETGERTTGNIDRTMSTVEAQFGIVESHFKGGARVELPIEDRTLYVPGG